MQCLYERLCSRPADAHVIALKYSCARANPLYLNHLAAQKMFDDPCFIAYLDYLQYFARPEYTRFLTCVRRSGPVALPLLRLAAEPCRRYPAPTLRALELLQQERFREDILSPDTVARLANEVVAASLDGFDQPQEH